MDRVATDLGPLGQLRQAWARINLDRLSANYKAVSAAASVPVMPVVKADAYGHGAQVVARRFQELGAPMLGVAYVEEGLALRRAGVTIPILVMAPFGHEQGLLIAEHGLTPVVSRPSALAWAVAAGRAARLSVHLKIDTGMTRLGFQPADLAAAAGALLDSGHVTIDGVMTQLASADEDADATERQLDQLDAALDELSRQGVSPRWVHAANSAGLAYLRPTHTLARVGLLLYGLRPRPLSPAVDVQPVMNLVAPIARLQDVPAGTAVSYGGRWVASRPSRIATLLIGYADGVPRTDGMRERGAFAVDGRRAPVVGNVCMDLTMLDVTDGDGVAEGSQAVLFGDEPTAWDVAEWAGTNAWQVLTSIGPRIPRVYLEGGEIVAVDSPHL